MSGQASLLRVALAAVPYFGAQSAANRAANSCRMGEQAVVEAPLLQQLRGRHSQLHLPLAQGGGTTAQVPHPITEQVTTTWVAHSLRQAAESVRKGTAQQYQ